MKQIEKLEQKVQKIYDYIFENTTNTPLYVPYTQEDMQQANKLVFLYQCGRINILQALYRLSLIYQHKSDEIYLEDNLHAFDMLGD